MIFVQGTDDLQSPSSQIPGMRVTADLQSGCRGASLVITGQQALL